jgi:2-keto-4-pentenoate hydratase
MGAAVALAAAVNHLSETYPGLAPADAYAIQSVLFDKKLARGARLVGRKVGLTSQAMQQQMGVDQPDYGFLLDTMAVPTGGVLTRNGEPVGTGTGAAVLGHPSRAVAGLANKLAEFGVTLQADQVVLSASMWGAVPFAPGDTFRATFTELGEASISFM